MKKYVFTGSTISYFGVILHQIQALYSFDNVSKGEIGGWIENESNLSHEGDCWVSGNAMVFGEARVYDNAQVFGNAKVFGNAQVFEYAKVYGDAVVFENAQVFGDARVYDNAIVYCNAQVCGATLVYDNMIVYKNKEEEEDKINDIMSLKLPDTISEVVHNGKRYKKEIVTTIKWVEVE